MFWAAVIVGILCYTLIEVIKINNEAKYKLATVTSKNLSSEEK
jgi:hypothetical protein